MTRNTMLLSPSSKLRIAYFIQNTFKSQLLPEKLERNITYADVYTHTKALDSLFPLYDEKMIHIETTDKKYY